MLHKYWREDSFCFMNKPLIFSWAPSFFQPCLFPCNMYLEHSLCNYWQFLKQIIVSYLSMFAFPSVSDFLCIDWLPPASKPILPCPSGQFSLKRQFKYCSLVNLVLRSPLSSVHPHLGSLTYSFFSMLDGKYWHWFKYIPVSWGQVLFLRHLSNSRVYHSIS